MINQHLILLQGNMQETHLLKFVHNGRTHPQNKGIRTFPHHTFGVSRQSPDYFHQKHTIINNEGYHYQHEHTPHFQYHSQKPSLALVHQKNRQIHDHDLQKPHLTMHQNPRKFHLKKGRLTEFLDKNAWMKTVYLLSGFERSEKARSLCNRDRHSKIKNLKEKVQYQSQMIKKPKINQSYYNTLQDIMSQKVRIRSRRNQQAERQQPLKQRTISELSGSELQNENIKNKLSKTTRQWYPSFKADKQSKRVRQMSFRQGKISNIDNLDNNQPQNLQEWQRKTCKSKWCYRANKADTFENQQQQLNQQIIQ